jgi:N-acetylglucosaminyl-diphospho-decaprenol L-rhamnosyltransferase
MGTHIALIVLNYRTPELTLQCLRSLEGQLTPLDEVVVVDNDSRDGSADAIQHAIVARRWRWARLVRSPVNGGFAAGNNLGIRSVCADAYVLLNSDTVVLPGALSELRSAMERYPRAGIIGTRFLDGEGRLDQSTFRDLTPLGELVRAANTGPVTRLFPRHEVPILAHEEVFEPDWVGFACVLIRRAVIDGVGLLDDGYFMYFEDIDYCRRARDGGFRVLFWPEARITHYLGSSSQMSGVRALRRRAPRYYYEARARYFAKFYGRRGLWLANALWTAGHCVSRAREWAGHRPSRHREREAWDVWTNALDPFRPPSARPRAVPTRLEPPKLRPVAGWG